TGVLAFAPISFEPALAVLAGEEQDQNEVELRSIDALNELVQYGLLEKTDQRWQASHSLVYTYARIKLALNKKNLQLLAAYYIKFCQSQNKAGLEGYARLDSERAHCLRLLEACLTNELWREIKALVATIEEYLDRQGHWIELLSAYEIRLTAARQAGDRKDEGRCLNSLGYTCWRRGEFDQALAWHEQSLPIVHELGDRQEEGVVLNNIGNIYREQGKYEQALQCYQQSLSIRQEVGDRKGEGAALNNIGQLYYYQGDYEQALRYYEQSLPVIREAGDKIGEGTNLNNIAIIRRALGKPSKALEYHQQALVINQELGDRAGEAQSYLNIGLTCYDLGDMPQTEEYISLAVEIAEAIEHPALEEWREELRRVREKTYK
ncbi:MAG: tetratricopeptide repeat protein, partial [Candidatus Electrothrix sp. AX1]|nr:tetratricopeptide repeat protein [Candidatus Electrothrix sp. AX1]